MIKLISPPHSRWVDGRPTTETYLVEAFVNPKYIISIDWNSDIKREHSVVTVQGAMTKSYSDIRTPDVVAQLVETELKQYL